MHTGGWRSARPARPLENALKIQPNAVPYADAGDAAGAQDARRRAPVSAPAGSPESTPVALSALSSSLTKADGDIDMARVQALRDAISKGELRIDASRIADGLIESARELIR